MAPVRQNPVVAGLNNDFDLFMCKYNINKHTPQVSRFSHDLIILKQKEKWT